MTELIELNSYFAKISAGDVCDVYSSSGYTENAKLLSITETDDGAVCVLETSAGTEAIPLNEMVVLLKVIPLEVISITPAALQKKQEMLVVPIGSEQIHSKC